MVSTPLGMCTWQQGTGSGQPAANLAIGLLSLTCYSVNPAAGFSISVPQAPVSEAINNDIVCDTHHLVQVERWGPHTVCTFCWSMGVAGDRATAIPFSYVPASGLRRKLRGRRRQLSTVIVQ